MHIGPLSWWASYTLSDVNDTVNGTEKPRSWDQRHSFLAGVSWSTKRWDAGIVASIHSGWPKTGLTLIEGVDASGEAEFTAIPGPRNAGRYKAFASLDARISRKFDVGRGGLTTFFEITNATNRKNVCCSDFDLEEDEDGNDSLDFSKDFWLPLLPAVGILWEF